MKDYVRGKGLLEEEDGVIMDLVVSIDHVSFEEIMMSSKWRKVVDYEINSIEKNQTWKLTYFPPGAKNIGAK